MDLLRALDNEWKTLATSRVVARRYATWQQDSELLATIPTLADLIDAAQERGDPERSDRLLAELARRSPTDEIAARALLQALMPSVRRIVTEHYRLADYNDLVATAVALMWERIRTYPIHRRPRAIAANLALDTRRELRRSLRSTPLMVSLDAAASVGGSDNETIAVLDVLDAARRILDHDTITLWIRSRGHDETIVSIAHERQQSPNALCERRRRAERQLRAVLEGAR